MAKTKLTDRTLKSLKPAPQGKRAVRWDDQVPGLAVRVTDKGKVTFVLIKRFPGGKHPVPRALGDYGAMSLEAARTKARYWNELVAKGIDPFIEEERQRQEELRKQRHTFAAVAEEFIKRHVSKTRKAAAFERELRSEFIDRWGGRPIADITQGDVKAVLKEAVDRGAPYQAHNLLVHIRSLFNWALGQGDDYGLDHSPCDRLKPKLVIGKKLARKRVLDDDEVRSLWRAAGKIKYPFGPIFQLLLLTGQRKSEVSDARWSEFDMGKRLWTIPAERMKADAAHVVPLTDEMIAILAELPRFKKGDYLFSTTFGAKPVSGFSKAKLRCDRVMLRTWRALGRMAGADRSSARFPDWVIHDIRRSMRTGLSALPVPDLVRELVIAHTKPGLHKVYDQYAYLDEKRRALELWNQRLKAILTPPAANVIELAAARA
jgi:integrase